MPELVLGFLLLFWSGLEVRTIPAADLDAGVDPCVAARAIVEQGACVDPEDCGAFDGWMRLFGSPRTEPLDPRLSEVARRPATYMCPAPSPQPPRISGGSG